MKADRRVAFAPGAVTNKPELAQAIVALADALARGDDKKFSAKIDPGARNDLKSLVASGQWANATKKIESVRVVRVMNGAEAAPVDEGPKITADQKAIGIQMILAALTDAQRDELKQELGHDPKPADADAIIAYFKNQFEQSKAAGTLNETQQKMVAEAERAIELFQSADAKPEKEEEAKNADASGMHTITLAVQEPGSAYVLGWIAVEVNGTWTFKASPAPQADPQRRASDFDRIFNTADAPASEADAPSESTPQGAS
jgi:hypothetical protein